MFKILPNTKKPLQNWPRFLKYCQSGEILPNLLTLNKANTENDVIGMSRDK